MHLFSIENKRERERERERKGLDRYRLILKNHRLFPTHRSLKKLKRGDYGLFGASWWPFASLQRLRIATYLALWVRDMLRALVKIILCSFTDLEQLFMWDDGRSCKLGFKSARLR